MERQAPPKPGPDSAVPPSLKFGDAWPLSPAPESRDAATVRESYGHYIGGRFVASVDGEMFDTFNPADEQKLSAVAKGTARDIELAVQSARSAFEGPWGNLSARDRGKYLFRIARLIQERAREFAVLESLDGGKPIRESRDIDVPLAAAHFFYYAGWADKLDYVVGARPRPLGVCGQIIPWNFPLLMAAWKLAPALAAGNTCVLKPAETTPLTALLLAELIEHAGLPAGTVNIVTGYGDAGAALAAHTGIDKVAFTGSTEVGKKIQLSSKAKRVTLELGGKAANIVFEDAPLDQAVEGVVNGIFFNQGHVCCAGSRLLVQESVADRFLAKLEDRIKTLVVGDPLDKNTDIGAINSLAQLEKIKSLVQCGIDEGCTLIQGRQALPDRGYFYRPSVFTGVAQSNRIAQEEIFGPVLATMTFRTPEEAVEKSNNTCYGLSAGIWTDKGSKIFKMLSAMRAGVVWANTFNKFDPTAPFGGYKESGYGREGGLQGLRPYLEAAQ